MSEFYQTDILGSSCIQDSPKLIPINYTRASALVHLPTTKFRSPFLNYPILSFFNSVASMDSLFIGLNAYDG